MARFIIAVVDLQYGSTGKGQIAGTLAHHAGIDTVVTAWGPNAGHTFYTPDGDKHVSRMLACSAVAPSVENILLGPGSVLDLGHLAMEIEARSERLRGKMLVIHPQATILQPQDAIAEQALLRIGSTMKGTMEATVRKMRRLSDVTASQKYDVVFGSLGAAVTDAGMGIAISSCLYDRAIDEAQKLMVEGAQGYSLGMHTDFYPYTTSRDVSTHQLFADCRIPWHRRNVWPHTHVVGVARTYPIRVANRYRGEGAEREQMGTSGGFYPDQQELQWSDIGQKPELTTVTQLPRRIFSFSGQQIKEAVRVFGPQSIALTFCDYVDALPDNKKPAGGVDAWIKAIGEVAFGVPVQLLSYGPRPTDVVKRLLPTDQVKQLLECNSDWLGW
jgi:adenylosuccinate synthase